MIGIEWEVPPRSVSLLQIEQNPREHFLVRWPFLLRERFDAIAGIAMSVVEKVSRHREPGFMRNRTFAADIEPTIALAQPNEPLFDHFIGNFFVAPEPQGIVTGLRTGKAATRAIDS